MRTNRHTKAHHNGKNRRTGRKSSERRNNKAPAKANSEHAESVRMQWVAAKRLEQERKVAEKAKDDVPCCANEAAQKVTNLRLLRELQSTVCDRVWNELRGRWEGVLPRAFVRKNAKHMPHFLDFARENGYRNR